MESKQEGSLIAEIASEVECIHTRAYWAQRDESSICVDRETRIQSLRIGPSWTINPLTHCCCYRCHVVIAEENTCNITPLPSQQSQENLKQRRVNLRAGLIRIDRGDVWFQKMQVVLFYGLLQFVDCCTVLIGFLAPEQGLIYIGPNYTRSFCNIAI